MDILYATAFEPLSITAIAMGMAIEVAVAIFEVVSSTVFEEEQL